MKANNKKKKAYHEADVKVFFSPDIILCGWLGLKHKLIKKWKQLLDHTTTMKPA